MAGPGKTRRAAAQRDKEGIKAAVGDEAGSPHARRVTHEEQQNQVEPQITPRTQNEPWASRRGAPMDGAVLDAPSTAEGDPSTSTAGGDLSIRGHETQVSSDVASVTSTERLSQKPRLLKIVLEPLLGTATSIFEFLTNYGLPDAESKADLSALRDGFEKYRSSFLRHSGAYHIDLDYVFEKLGVEGGSDAWARATDIIAATNYVTLMDDMTEFHDLTDEKRAGTLQAWSNSFPKDFLSSTAGATSEMIFAGTLDIWTQLFISKAKTSPDLDLVQLICDVFYEKASRDDFMRYREGGPSLQYRRIPGIAPREEWLYDRIKERVDGLYDLITKIEVTQADMVYPLADFLEHLGQLATSCFQELKTALVRRDAVALFAIQPSQDQSRFAPQLATQAQSLANSAVLSTPEPTRSLREYAQETGLNLERVIDDFIMSETHHLGAVSQEDVYSSQHYAMPSPGQLPVAGSLYAQSAVNSLKRGAPTVEDNVFESDGKVPDKKRRRQTKPTKKRPSDTVQLSATGGLSYPAPPGFGLGESGGPVAGVPDLDTLSQRSRQIAAANRKPKEPQSRVAWTRNDCQLLIRAVESFSCKWSHIEEEIKNGLLPFEHKRDQQALRDKARLLKQDFLKTDCILPPGFDLVILGKKEKQAIIACGRNPFRREAEINLSDPDHPVPYNTMYQSDDATEGAPPATLPEASQQTGPDAVDAADATEAVEELAVPEPNMSLGPAEDAQHADPVETAEQVMQPEPDMQADVPVDPDMQANVPVDPDMQADVPVDPYIQDPEQSGLVALAQTEEPVEAS